jgi:hypothetical protein
MGPGDDLLAQLSLEAQPSLLPVGLWEVVAWLIFFFFFFFFWEGEAGCLPLLSQEAPVAVAVLTGLLAFLLGWLAALEGQLCPDRPGG